MVVYESTMIGDLANEKGVGEIRTSLGVGVCMTVGTGVKEGVGKGVSFILFSLHGLFDMPFVGSCSQKSFDGKDVRP